MALLKQHSVYTGDRDGSRVVSYGWHFSASARALWLAAGSAAALAVQQPVTNCPRVSGSGPLLLALHSQTANPRVSTVCFERADIMAKCLSTPS